jgi:hypothetical protein
MIFTPIVLVCLASQPRDACTKDTAADLIYGEPATTEATCALYGRAALASTSIGQSLRDGQWIKVVCERGKAPA